MDEEIKRIYQSEESKPQPELTEEAQKELEKEKSDAFTYIYPILAIVSAGCAIKCYFDNRLTAAISMFVLGVLIGAYAAFRTVRKKKTK